MNHKNNFANKKIETVDTKKEGVGLFARLTITSKKPTIKYL